MVTTVVTNNKLRSLLYILMNALMNVLINIFIGISIVLTVSNISAYAQGNAIKDDTTNYIDETDLMDDVQTVTSATRLKQKITDAPVSVTIIDSEMIEASGATEVHELMRLVPGFFSYSIWGNQFAVSNHSQPIDVDIRLEVQVNGRSVYEPLFTTVDWPSLGIDVVDIDYIEVIRGSSATVYGSNAFLGAINIITKDALSRPKISVRTRLGNIGREELTLNHSGNVRDVDYAFSLVHKNNTGFPALDSPSKLRDLANDSRDSLNLSLQGSYVPSLENELKFEIGLGRTDIEIPSADVQGFNNREHNSYYQKLKWINKGGSVERSLQLLHSKTSLNDDFNLGLLSDFLSIPPDQVPVFFPGQQDQLLEVGLHDSFSQRYDIEFEQKGSVSRADYVWGLGARTDRVKSPTFFGEGTQSENRFRLFSNLDWRINKKLNTNLGFLVEKTQFSDLAFSPRVALNFHPKKNHTIRTSFTNGKRVPSVTFQNSNAALRLNDGSVVDVDTIGSGNLGTETVTAYELGYNLNIPSINSQFDIKLFREELKNLVGLQVRSFNDLDQSVRVWDNIINTTTQGVELQATHGFKRIAPGLNARLAYAYFDTDGLVVNDARTPDNPRQASAIPRHSATLLLSKKLGHQFNVSSVLQYQSDFRNKDAEIKRVDFKIGKKIHVGHSKGKASFVVQNAFNEYNDFARRNQFKTRAFIQLELDF